MITFPSVGRSSDCHGGVYGDVIIYCVYDSLCGILYTYISRVLSFCAETISVRPCRRVFLVCTYAHGYTLGCRLGYYTLGCRLGYYTLGCRLGYYTLGCRLGYYTLGCRLG